MNFVYGAFPLAALVALALLGARYAKRRNRAGDPVPVSSWAWAVPATLVLAFLFAWWCANLVDQNHMMLVSPIVSAIVAACAYVSIRRTDVWRWYDRRPVVARRAICIGMAVLLPVLAMLMIEVPFNDYMPKAGPSFAWLEMLLAALLLLGLYFLGQRHTAACGVGLALFFITGIGQYFIKRFKNAAILPTDLLVLSTAAAVGKEYVFALNARVLEGMALGIIAVTLLSLVRPPQAKAAARTVAINLASSAASFGLLTCLVLVPSYFNMLGVQMKYWYSIDYYQMQGFYPTFLAVLQDMPIKKPEGYSDQLAADLTHKHAEQYRAAAAKDKDFELASAQFEEIKPSVIVVMNESFSDLSIYDGMHAGYEGPKFFKTGFDDALAKGTLNVTVHGAGTCNTEFEFLTGNALGFIGQGKYPYSIYDLSKVDALAAQFKQWGYQTTAIHPNYATNWNRDKIYPQMGFDQFLSIDDYGGMPNMAVDTVTPNEPHAEVFHSGVTDAATYDTVLEKLKGSDEPQFVFDVTMANHGSYDQDNIPEDYQQDYQPADFVGKETPERLNEYLACIEKSDDDLEAFVAELKKLDRPVVLVFFGDHQPSLSLEYNDYWYTDEPDDVHGRRAFSTDYVIWANYDVAGRDQKGTNDETSVDMLASQTLDLIGAPTSDYQAAQLDIRKSIPSLSASGYKGNDQMWYAPADESAYAQDYHDMSLIEYLNFATKV